MNPSVKSYLAAIGSKGGKAKGLRKKRPHAHYVAAGKASAAARKAKADATKSKPPA
jgi:hypothetical protein